MAVGDMPFRTPSPGDVAPTTFPGAESKTREVYDSTEPPGPTRRRLILLSALGAAGLVIGGAIAWPKGNSDQPEATVTPTPTGENPFKYNEFGLYPQVFFGPDGKPFERGPEDLRLPESFDPPTFAEAFANMGQAIEYYVNEGDFDGIERIIPGTVSGDALSPEQFKERSIFTTTFRRSGDTPTLGPENVNSRYAWGFQVKMLEQLSAVGADPRDTKQVKAHVQIAMGDYRKPLNGSYRRWTIEQPIVFEGEMLLSRYTNIRTGERPPDGGWCVWQMPMYNLPPTIRDYPPEGYEEMPLLYPGLGI